MFDLEQDAEETKENRVVQGIFVGTGKIGKI
jgi:hypothetical protein